MGLEELGSSAKERLLTREEIEGESASLYALLCLPIGPWSMRSPSLPREAYCFPVSCPYPSGELSPLGVLREHSQIFTLPVIVASALLSVLQHFSRWLSQSPVPQSILLKQLRYPRLF